MGSTTATPILPDLDPAVGNEIGDEILLDAAAASKVAKVKSGGTSTRFTGSQSRAWSLGGNVD